MRPIDLTFEHNGERYFSVKHFAWATRRSEINVRHLIRDGNKFAKLKTVRIVGRIMIPYSELLKFPFTLSGRNNTEVYHYDEAGKQVSRTEVAK